MDLKTLKLELLERIALIDDEMRLHAIKRLLDAPRGYGIPNEQLSVVKEGEVPYLKLEDRMYSADEVRALLERLMNDVGAEKSDPASLLSAEEWDELDADHAAHLRGEGRTFTWDEIKEQLRTDRGA